jgi:DNA-binding response OmpR family regulator
MERASARPAGNTCAGGAGRRENVLKILIAEDDPFFRRLLQKMLTTDFEVVTAEDGTTAWTMIQQSTVPVLAVLDWVMPGLAGPEVCREVRANPATAGAYLILLTSRNSSADILSGLRAGADDYITKPFEPEELRARVRGGRRIIELRQEVMAVRAELESALLRERTLRTQLIALQQNGGTKELAKSASA